MSCQSRMNSYPRLGYEFSPSKLENAAHGVVIFAQICDLKRHNVHVDTVRQLNEWSVSSSVIKYLVKES